MQAVLNNPATNDPKLRRWSKSEYHEMAELGWFRDQRAELIEGEIVVLSPQKFEHGQIADRATEIMRNVFGPGFWCRMQLPLNLGPNSEPEPDVSVVRGRRDDYHEHPTSALLVIEVSDTTLAFDRSEKASLYARAGIQEYWVLDLVLRQLHVYRSPFPDPAKVYGFWYQSITSFARGQTVSPLAASGGSIAVSDLL